MSHDFSKPYTSEELEGLREIFRSSPTYSEAGDCISACDGAGVLEKMGYSRTPEQIAAYQDYWQTHFGGILTMDDFIRNVSQLHENSKLAREVSIKMDTDHDGFITSKEFEAMMELMRIHDPKLKSVLFEDFVHEADANKDGKVSIDECTDWLEKHLASN